MSKPEHLISPGPQQSFLTQPENQAQRKDDLLEQRTELLGTEQRTELLGTGQRTELLRTEQRTELLGTEQRTELLGTGQRN